MLKNKTRQKIVAAFIAVLLLLQVAAVMVAAEDTSSKPYEYGIPTEVIPAEKIEANGHIGRSFESEEEMNQVCMTNENGTNTMYMFDYPVKYVDDEDGIIKDKSNKLYNSKRNNYLYVNSQNDVRTYFPKKIIKKPIITEVQGYKIEIGIVSNSKYAKKGELIGDNYVFYDKAFGEDTAIGYTADFNGYKEEIILYSSNSPTEYSFEIYCEGLEAVNNSGILEFFDENTKEKIFSTDPFYIYDSSEEIKEYTETEYELAKTDDYSYLLTIALDSEYLASGVTYPIYIDPAVKYNNTQYIKDAPIYKGTPDTNYGNAAIGYIGTYNSTYGVGRMLFGFGGIVESSELFQTLPETQIISVHLNIYNSAMGVHNALLTVNEVLGVENWDEDSVTWNTIPSNNYGPTIASGMMSASQSGYCYFDITSVALTWRGEGNQAADRGVLLRSINQTNTSYVKAICTKNYSSSNAPYLTLNYSKQVPDGTYYIQNVRTNLFADYEGFLPTEGTKVELKNFNSLANGEWRIEKRLDGYYSIIDLTNGYFLGVNNNSGANNASIVYLSNGNVDGAKWTFSISSSGNYIITAKSSGTTNRVLSVPNTDPTQGSNLIQFGYTDDDNYKDEWILHNWSDIVGYLPYWYADVKDSPTAEDKVYYFDKDVITVYIENYIAQFGDFDDAVNSAVLQWSSVLGVSVSFVTNESLAHIRIYGVTEEYYSDNLEKGEWPNGLQGFADPEPTPYLDESSYAFYNNQIRRLVPLIYSEVYILYVPGKTQSMVNNTVLHEVGHAFGWAHHTSGSSNIMYGGNTDEVDLTYKDIDHLRQVYDLMR